MAIATVGEDRLAGEDFQDLNFHFAPALPAAEKTQDLYVIDALDAGPPEYPAALYKIHGSDFTYDGDGKFTGGVVGGWELLGRDGEEQLAISGVSIPATRLAEWIGGHNLGLAPLVFSADDSIVGGAGPDGLWGFGGDDTILGGAGDDRIAGGGPAGYFFLRGPRGLPVWASDGFSADDGANVLRGGPGNDQIQGGSGFDDVNGNTGNDTLSGGPGDDLLRGGAGGDLLNGNTGNEALYGDLGPDTVGGGQGDDVIEGGDGSDWLSGDRGNDTVTGGIGSDVFHSFGAAEGGAYDGGKFAGAGTDLITDFNAAEGDRVVLDLGTTYTVSQVGDDTVVDMGSGDRIILAGVQLSTLPDGWIAASHVGFVV